MTSSCTETLEQHKQPLARKKEEGPWAGLPEKKHERNLGKKRSPKRGLGELQRTGCTTCCRLKREDGKGATKNGKRLKKDGLEEVKGVKQGGSSLKRDAKKGKRPIKRKKREALWLGTITRGKKGTEEAENSTDGW